MEMILSELPDDAIKISLRGRLDTAGVDAIESRFSAAAKSRHALVDLSGVSFVASMGIRMFFSSARALKAAGRRFILVAPQGLVNEVLDNAGVSQIIPVVADVKQALELLPPPSEQPIAAPPPAAAPPIAAAPPSVAVPPPAAAPAPAAVPPPAAEKQAIPAPVKAAPQAKPAAAAPPPRVDTPPAPPPEPARDSRRTLWIVGAIAAVAVLGLAALFAGDVFKASPPASKPAEIAPQPARPDSNAVVPPAAPVAGDAAPAPASVAETPPKAPAPDAASSAASSPPATGQVPPGTPSKDTDAATGTVRIAIKPWGEVIVDGVNKGVSPPLKRLSLAEGRHRIEITNPGFPTHSTEIEVAKDQAANLVHEFK